jgi:hypothetical protein
VVAACELQCGWMGGGWAVVERMASWWFDSELMVPSKWASECVCV